MYIFFKQNKENKLGRLKEVIVSKFSELKYILLQ